MRLQVKLGTGPAYPYWGCKLRKLPVVGQVFEIKDMEFIERRTIGARGRRELVASKFSRPIQVRLTQIKDYSGDTKLYLCEKF